MRWEGPGGYFASDDPALINLDQVHEWISQSYWAEGRPRQTMATAIENSLVIGLYTADGTQVGFARFVTDYATFAWLCDVFVDSAHRGRRLGAFLADAAIGHPGVRGVRQILAAEPGRTLYARFGYRPLARPERWMERPGQVP
ncbi:MAG TPA: GNAT family N-acetyltransferase [Streptosporangiaceae bacterium]|nr:GNAT family N-acetyltransferase [Streptosporangiaceae bacterium]